MADPLGVGSCSLWLDASDSSTITSAGGLVSQWNDKSGSANNVTATLAKRPTTGSRYLNGRNVLDFDGVANQMQSPSFALTMPFTVAAVAQNDDGANSAYGLIVCDVTNGRWIGKTNANVWAIFSGTTLSSAAADTSLHRHIGLYKASPNAVIRVDGTETSGNTGAGSWGGGVFIGSDNASGAFWDGPIAETVVYSAELTAAQRADLDNYFYRKWIASPAIVVTTPPRMFHPRTIKVPILDQAGATSAASDVSLDLSPATVTVTPQANAVTLGAVSIAQSPATVTVTPQTQGITSTVALALSPATITVTPQADGVTVGAVSKALSPATVTVTGQAQGISLVTPTTLALSPATVTVEAQRLPILLRGVGKLATLIDTFTSFASPWDSEIDSNTSVVSGQLVVGSVNGYTDGAATVSGGGGFRQDVWDFTESRILCEFLPANGTTDGPYQFYVYDAAGSINTARFTVTGGNLVADTAGWGSNTVLNTATYNPTSHRWLRLSLAGSTLTFATSPDSTTWTTFATDTLDAGDLVEATRVIPVFANNAATNLVVDNVNSPTAVTPPVVTTPEEPAGGGKYAVSAATRAQWRRERQEYEDAQAFAELLEREDEELLILL